MNTCYSCGSSEKLTRDHLPPKSFFPKPRPSNLITVLCCETCNNGFSKDDEYFRLAASGLINANSHGKRIWRDRVVNSTLKSRRLGVLLDEVRHAAHPTSLNTEGGSIPASALYFEVEPINRFLIRLTKGLISVTHPEVDRNQLEFEITQIDQFKLDSILISGVAERFTHFERGNGVYRHWRGMSEDDAHFGVWVHMFYDAATWMLKHTKIQG